jgi:hypothetical protein
MMPLTRFGFHVTGLAESHQVLTPVGFLSGREFSEWSGVIDRQAITYIDATMRTDPILLSHDLKPYLRPAASPIRLGSADPEWRIPDDQLSLLDYAAGIGP